MRVIGVDPSPARGLHTFDGADRHVRVTDAHDYLDGLKGQDVLLCWDAPLTGPSEAVRRGAGIRRPSEFTQRPIEAFFRRKRFGFKAPKGISVQGYASCQHWTISRALLGLPRVGPWDAELDALPFQLAHDSEERPRSGRWVVEVHPGLAAWLWCRDGVSLDTWDFKHDPAVLSAMWNEVVTRTGGLLSSLEEPADDDQFDARVAYALGRIWLEGGSVELVGDLDNGTFLLPHVTGLSGAFRKTIG